MKSIHKHRQYTAVKCPPELLMRGGRECRLSMDMCPKTEFRRHTLPHLYIISFCMCKFSTYAKKVHRKQ